jgi:hypothetical protein
VADIKSIASAYDKAYYRLLSTPEATWLYVEMFNLESQARQFCDIAGGKLASVTSETDTAQIETLLNTTLAPRAESNYDASRAKVIMWIDLKRASGDKAETRWMWGSLVRGMRNTIVTEWRPRLDPTLIRSCAHCMQRRAAWPQEADIGSTWPLNVHDEPLWLRMPHA